MGLSDRDYMRDRARSHGARSSVPSGGGIGWPWILLFWVLAGFILFKIFDSYGPAKKRGGSETVRMEQPAEQPAPEAMAPPPSRQAQDRHVRSTESASIENPVSGAPSRASETASPSNTIYLCRAYSGGTFWANTHCNQHSALIERIAYVPSSLPFNQQVAIATEQHRDNAALIRSQVTTSQASGGPDARQGECKALDARVAQLDALARQPQSAAMQDWISAQRKGARDRQFRLRC